MLRDIAGIIYKVNNKMNKLSMGLGTDQVPLDYQTVLGTYKTISKYLVLIKKELKNWVDFEQALLEELERQNNTNIQLSQKIKELNNTISQLTYQMNNIKNDMKNNEMFKEIDDEELRRLRKIVEDHKGCIETCDKMRAGHREIKVNPGILASCWGKTKNVEETRKLLKTFGYDLSWNTTKNKLKKAGLVD